MHHYEYRHRISLEETNVVGNVYFAHFIRWQGNCREMFLLDHAPDLARDLGRDFTMATTRVSCSYYAELAAFDDILIRMSAKAMTPSRLTMVFQYYRVLPNGKETLVADGEQEVVCVRREGTDMAPVPIPATLREAVLQYSEPGSPFAAGYGPAPYRPPNNEIERSTAVTVSTVAEPIEGGLQMDRESLRYERFQASQIPNPQT